MIHKKSQTGVIVVIVLVLIAIVAVVLIWNFLMPFLMEKTQGVNVQGVTSRIEIKKAIVFVTGLCKIQVEKTSGEEELDSIKFIFYDEDGKSFTKEFSDTLGLMESREYSIFPEGIGKIKKISVYPVIGKSIGIESSVSENILEIPGSTVAWYNFDNSYSDSVSESSGILNGDTELAAENGKRFARFNNGWLNLGNNSRFNLNDFFAISVWIKTSDSNSIILRKGSYPNYEINIQNGKIGFSYSSAGVLQNIIGTKTISDNTWHNIIATNMMIYVDGGGDKVLGIDSLSINSEDLVIGENLIGDLDDLMIFNKSLDANQAKNIFVNLK